LELQNNNKKTSKLFGVLLLQDVLIRHYGQILTVFPKVFKTTFNFGNVKALALNYHGAISIKKINIHSSKVAGQSEVTAISQANLDLAKEQFQESLK
jgi:anionic cell wall polymer biosynthesis LytR-Cps2A-Psr (LCP) family protein